MRSTFAASMKFLSQVEFFFNFIANTREKQAGMEGQDWTQRGVLFCVLASSVPVSSSHLSSRS